MKTKILSPLRRDGYKAGMIMMLIALSTMLLTTACSNDDDLVNNENTATKGYALPVTINVTRQGDATTRATYTDNGNGTGSLAFSAGDKLFVFSYNGGSAGMYAGVLDWVSDGTFSGTITTQNPYTGTIDALLSGGAPATAVLLPAGYGDYGYLSTEGNSGSYSDTYDEDYTKAFVASTTEKTAKALAVEQFSFESATYESGGFALEPNNAILNFTITGLTDGEKAVTLKNGSTTMCTGSVTPTSGTATFAVGIGGSGEINPLTLTVGGKEITITSTNTVFTAGKIYNITRSALTYPIALGDATSDYVGSVVTTDGNVYATVDAASAASKTAAAMIAYVSDTGHGLALALEDEGWMDWSTAKTTCEAHTPAVTGGTWQLPSQEGWNNMITAAGSYTALRDGFSSFGGTNMNAGTYWSSTDAGTMYSIQLKYGYKFHEGEGSWGSFGSTSSQNTRACLTF